MMRIFRELLIFSLYMRVFSFKFYLKKNHYDDRTSEALIFEQCKNDYETIVINDDFKQLGPTWLQQLHNRSAILHKTKYKYQHEFYNVKKVDAILIITSSLNKLKKIIGILGKTMWWNVMIPVYILNLPDNNCEMAITILQRMWRNQILTSYFLCIEKNEVQVYTYNPFTSRAPSNWIKINISTKNPRLALYRRKYQTETICRELDFDRTKFLDGYPIKAVAPLLRGKDRSFSGHYINYNDKHWNGSLTNHENRLIINALTKTLNVSFYLYLIGKDISGKHTGFTTANVEEVFRNESANLMFFDFDLYLKNELVNSELTLTYPLAWHEIGIVTYNRGYQTLGEKVWNFYGIWTVLFTVFVLLVTFIVIWFSESRRTAFAVFEIIRLFISHSLYTRMNSLSLRIFFFMILIYFMIIQATFNGHLAKFLTKSELRRHPETHEDLKDLGYTSVYDSRHVKKYLAGAHQGKKLNKVRTQICLNHILYNDSSVACVFNHFYLLTYLRSMKTKNLYISKRTSDTIYSAFHISKHWPLWKRVNVAIMLLEEMGFRKRRSSKVRFYMTHNSTVVEARSNGDFHPIKLENLMFSFWILAVGLISATLSFFFEMFINLKSKCNLISNVKKDKAKSKNY